jgi:hypothetical protein
MNYLNKKIKYFTDGIILTKIFCKISKLNYKKPNFIVLIKMVFGNYHEIIGELMYEYLEKNDFPYDIDSGKVLENEYETRYIIFTKINQLTVEVHLVDDYSLISNYQIVIPIISYDNLLISRSISKKIFGDIHHSIYFDKLFNY